MLLLQAGLYCCTNTRNNPAITATGTSTPAHAPRSQISI